MATNASPDNGAPAGVAPAVKNISMADLQRELKPAAPKPQAAEQLSEPPKNFTQGDDKGNRDVEPAIPGLRDAAKKLLDKKKEEQASDRKEDKVVKKEEKPVKKEVVSADDAPAKPAATEGEGTDDVPDEQLRVMPHDKPDTAKRIKKFLANESRLKKELDEAKKVGSGATPEEIQKLRQEVEAVGKEKQALNDELLKYRRLHDIDSDPEFKTKYDEPMTRAESDIEGVLKRYGFSDGTLKVIKDSGGFAEFSRSSKSFTIQEPDPKDPSKTVPRTVTAAELSASWLGGMNLADAEAVKASLGKQQLLRSEKVAAREKAGAEAKQYFENQTKAQREAAEAAKRAADEGAKQYEKWVQEASAKTDWLQDKPVPDNASEDERKSIEEHNEFNKQLRDSLGRHPKDATEYGQLKLDAAEAHHLRRVNGELQAKIAQLEEASKAARTAARTVPRGPSIIRSSQAEKRDEAPADPTDLKGGLRSGLKKFTGSIDE